MENMNQNANNATNEGISFVELFSLLKRNIILIAIVTLVFTIIGGIYGKFIKKPVYSATATALVQVESSSMTEYNAFVYAQYLVNSMSEFIVSDNVTKEVAKVLIDEQYQFTHKENNDTVIHFSNLEQKEYTEEEYEKLVSAKSTIVKNGTKISYNDESLIIKITYSLEEVDENTDEEVIKTVNLLIQKTKEVSLTSKNPTPLYKFYTYESFKALVYAYEKKYNTKFEVDYEKEQITGFKDENFKVIEPADLTEKIKEDKAILEKNFFIYYEDDTKVIAIKSSNDSKNLDPDIASDCLVYLNTKALENPDKYVKEYLYPTFANKLVEMNNQPSYATKSTKTTLIVIIAFILGVALSCGIVLVRYLLDDTFKSRTQLEEATGINVLTSIPKFNIKEEENDEIE